MTVDVIDLAKYLNQDITSETEGKLQSALEAAVVMVDDVLSSSFREVPEAVRDQIVLDTAHALFKRGDSLSGQAQYAFDGGVPVFQSKDPLQKSWPLIRRYVMPF